jgi:hypothetical protein
MRWQEADAKVTQLTASLEQLARLSSDCSVGSARLQELDKQAESKRAQLQVGLAGGRLLGRGLQAWGAACLLSLVLALAQHCRHHSCLPLCAGYACGQAH